MPIISIVVPVYNVEDYLEACVKSITNQQFKNIEVLLIDDGSTDRSGEICEEFSKIDSRIKVIHKENGGLSDARNCGLSACSGEFVTFIDSDDTVDKDYLTYLYNLVDKYQAEMSICTHRTILSTERVVDKNKVYNKVLTSTECMEKILYDKELDISAWAKLYKIDLFNKIKFPVGKLFEDAFTTYKLVMASNRIGVGGESKYTYMVREGSIVTSKFTKSKMDLIDACVEMENILGKKRPKLKKALNRKVVYAYVSTINSMLGDNTVSKIEVEKLRKLILARGRNMIFDKRVSLRDKIAVIELFFGIRIYKVTWNTYQKLSGRM